MVSRHYGLQPYMCKLCDKTFSEPSAAHKHVKATHKKADRSLVMVNNPDWSQLQVIVPDNFFIYPTYVPDLFISVPCSIADPDFGPLGSGSVSHRHWIRFRILQAKIVRKTLIPTVCGFLSLKNDVMYLQKNLEKNSFLLAS